MIAVSTRNKQQAADVPKATIGYSTPELGDRHETQAEL